MGEILRHAGCIKGFVPSTRVHSGAMDETFHIYLSSKDSVTTHNNSASDFSKQLPERVQLEGGKWVCGLLELILPKNPQKPLYVCSDICSNSIIDDFKLPVLGRITTKTTRPNNITFVNVNVRELSSIRIYLREDFRTQPSFSSGISYCALRFQRDEAVSTYP